MSVGSRRRFGASVRRLRTDKGMSQETLADVCNLHRTYIGSIECGERNVSIDSMARVADALSTELADLLAQR